MITNILYKVLLVLILLYSNFIFSQDSYGISKEFHERKREELRSQMNENTVAVLFSYPIRNRSNTIDYVYHQNPNFYYLTGWKEPHAVLIIYKNNQKDEFGTYNEILFVRDRNPFDEQWNGKRMGVEGAKDLGFDRVYDKKIFFGTDFNFDQFDEVLLTPFHTGVKNFESDKSDLFDLQNQLKEKINFPDNFNLNLIEWYKKITFMTSSNSKLDIEKSNSLRKELRNLSLTNNLIAEDKIIQSFINLNKRNLLLELNGNSSVLIPNYNYNFIKLSRFLTNQREIKTKEEINLLRKAIKISSIGQVEVMKAVNSKMSEREIQGIHQYIYKKYGASHEGYPSIVGAGNNACILHYMTNDKKNIENQLVLMDLGAEYNGYTADVTRTIPVNGKFTEEQRKIYEIVYRAQEAGIKVAVAGNSFSQVYEATKKIIIDGLINLGILDNEMGFLRYFPHGVIHHIGLDVHDLGNYSFLDFNMIVTVEPGIYIPEGSPCDPKWWSIGIRLEDDILITRDGNENLSEFAPRKWKEVEKMMKKKSPLDQFNLPRLDD
jgi:Xaa-Pro aminopeptidase